MDINANKNAIKNENQSLSANFVKIFIITFIVLLILITTIHAVILFIAFQKPAAPEFQVKNVHVKKFNAYSPTPNQEPLVVSCELLFNIDVSNKNSLLGLTFENMLLDTSWNEVDAHLGETNIEDFVHKRKGVSTLGVTNQGEMEVPMKSAKVEDMSLDLVLTGQLHYYAGAFKTKTHAFMVFCDNIFVHNVNTHCRTDIFNNGELPPPEERKSSTSAEGPGAQSSKEDYGEPSPESFPPLKLVLRDNLVVMDNSLVEFTISRPGGRVTGIKFNGMDNILDADNPEDDRGYWNIVWNPGSKGNETKGKEENKGAFVRVGGSSFRIIVYKADQIELSFKFSYNPLLTEKDDLNPPMDIDVRYIMLRGVAGLYSYAIFERGKWPALNLGNARLAFKLLRQKGIRVARERSVSNLWIQSNLKLEVHTFWDSSSDFEENDSHPMQQYHVSPWSECEDFGFRYMVVSDDRQRKMPVPEDRIPPKSKQLAYPEAMKLLDPQDSEMKGEVDDKYQYSMESQYIRVHGWICKDPPTGFWQITPSYEFRSGGPNKQFLTSHVGPSTLAMFVSAHYSGSDLVPKFADDEPWKHVYGPVFMYMNNASQEEDYHTLWDDAKLKMSREVRKWPYRFPASHDFAKAYRRVNITGRFFVHDKFVTDNKVPAKGAFIGLAPPGEAGSWQKDCKNYQFWTQTDDEGKFNITYVRVGTYDVFGWVNGYVGNFKRDAPVLNLTLGTNVDLGELVYKPPRDGPTVWEIGVPDRTAKEFYIPDPDPYYVNKLYVNHTDRYRQYGLWERYAELYPDGDLVYDVASSDYKKDWFFAQVTRKIGQRYNGTTWHVKFNVDNVVQNGVYKLRLALASATNSYLEVRFNEPKPSPPLYNTGTIGDCNSVARHGIHGLYFFYTVDVLGSLLKKGPNTLYLTQTKGSGPFQGIMYDYLRFESPSTSSM